jgi:hypothetical protein
MQTIEFISGVYFLAAAIVFIGYLLRLPTNSRNL